MAVQWFDKNEMIVNADKFKAIIITKNVTTNVPKKLFIGDCEINIENSVKLLGIQIDNKLNFNLHISNICKSASQQMNALMRLKCFLGFKEKNVLINSFVISNFNYCPLVWFIASANSVKKIENLQKRALRFLYNDYTSSYDELLKKSGKSTIKVKNIKNLCIEIFKTLNNLNPSFMKDLFNYRVVNHPVRDKYKLNLEIPKVNQVKYGVNSLKRFGPKIWNTLPYHIKSSENLEKFKSLMKDWNGTNCQCIVCKLLN